MWSSLAKEIRKQWEKWRLEHPFLEAGVKKHFLNMNALKTEPVQKGSRGPKYRKHNTKVQMQKRINITTENFEKCLNGANCEHERGKHSTWRSLKRLHAVASAFAASSTPGDTCGLGGWCGLPRAPISLHWRTFLAARACLVPRQGRWTLWSQCSGAMLNQRWQQEGDSQLLGSPEGPQQHQVPMAHPLLSPVWITSPIKSCLPTVISQSALEGTGNWLMSNSR